MKDLKATTRANRRRYYLKQKLKDVLSISSHSKEVSVSDSILGKLSILEKRYLFELRDRFGYNLQYTI